MRTFVAVEISDTSILEKIQKFQEGMYVDELFPEVSNKKENEILKVNIKI